MKEERLNKDLKYFVTKQLSNLPKFMESWSQSCARAHFVSPHPCPTVGSLLPALSALLPLCSQQRRLERRDQEQAGGQEPDPFAEHSDSVTPLSVFTSSWGFWGEERGL